MSIIPSFIEHIKISDFNYSLPDEKIAKYPLSERDASKLLVYKNGNISNALFSEITKFLLPGDLLVFNNTKVIPARLIFDKSTGAKIEIFCLEPIDPPDYASAFMAKGCTWKCIVGNLKKWKTGILVKEILINNNKINIKAEKIADFQTSQHIHFSWNANITFEQVIEAIGITPIPPYLKRESEESDKERYQTVYSRVKGSVAAPTAGLHFTDNLLNLIKSTGVEIAELTLHVGAGTFKPVQTDTLTDHEMHTEFFSVSTKTLKKLINKSGNIISVGTTTFRTLESLYWLGLKVKEKTTNAGNLTISQWEAYKPEGSQSYSNILQHILNYLGNTDQEEIFAETSMIMVPGYNPKSTKALITNFHQPKSTLLLLVASFIGENWKKVYNYALENDFRFLSYGDGSILFR